MACLCAGLMVVSAQAAFQVVEDFDNLELGNINRQNGWVVKLTSGEVVLDPAGGSSQALKVLTESGTLNKAASVAQGTTRMLFLRFRYEEHGQFSFGLSHQSNPDEFSDFGPELGMGAATAADPSNDFRVANGLTTGIYDALETLAPTTWYNTWVLLDSTSDTYQVWMSSDPGGNAQASDQLANNAAETVFGFRTATATDLINFFIKTGGGASPVDGQFYIDDIYLEDTDDINLNNPLGEVDCNLDVDANGVADALSDGLLVIRYLFGLRGPALVHDAVDPGDSRTTAEIEAYLAECATSGAFDVDLNSKADALTDGLLVIRYLFGIRGNPLVNDAVDLGGGRTLLAEIEAYLEGLMP